MATATLSTPIPELRQATTDRVLVIAHDGALRKILQRLFSTEGYEVDVAPGGVAGLEILGQRPHSAVVLDLPFPAASAVDLCRRIVNSIPGLPFVILSASADLADKTLLLKTGADDYVTIPFSPKELVERLRAVMRRRLHVSPRDRDLETCCETLCTGTRQEASMFLPTQGSLTVETSAPAKNAESSVRRLTSVFQDHSHKMREFFVNPQIVPTKRTVSRNVPPVLDICGNKFHLSQFSSMNRAIWRTAMKQTKPALIFLLALTCSSAARGHATGQARTVVVPRTAMVAAQQCAGTGATTLDALREKRAMQVFLRSVERQIVSAADAMPATKYGFIPTDGEFKGVRTFGAGVKHLAATNNILAAAALGEEPPADAGDEMGPESVRSKAEILDYLNASFAHLGKAIDAIDEKNATVKSSPISPLKATEATRLALTVEALIHAFDHYGQMVEYLRMNGIVPPASRL